MMKTPLKLVLPILLLFLGACGGEDDVEAQQEPVPKSYRISGTILSTSALSAADVKITAFGNEQKAVTTDSAGTFIVAGLKSGTYVLRPTRPGTIFDPAEIEVIVQASDVSGIVFSPVVPDEGMSIQDLERLDSESDADTSPENIILPNGMTLKEYAESQGFNLDQAQTESPKSAVPASGGPPVGQAQNAMTGPQERKNTAIMKMIAAGKRLACAREATPCDIWNYPEDTTDPSKAQPAQNGLTYIYGGKTPSKRTKPVDGCPEYTFGVDCSGLIQRIASVAGLDAPSSSSSQANPNGWVVPSDWGLKLDKVSSGPIQAGDILLWPDHVGIATSASVVISATGNPGHCSTNIKPKKGPRALTIAQLGKGSPSGILRLMAPLSGDWDLSIKCVSQDAYITTIRFKINNDAGGAFSAFGAGTDYSGAPLSFELSGNYEPESNVLSATLALTNNSRSDYFSQTLLFDEIGPFNLTRVIVNGGCEGAARLSRVSIGQQEAGNGALADAQLHPIRGDHSRIGWVR